MTGVDECRVLTDAPATGTWNMARDEALLRCVQPGDGCTWRYYGWTPATLSLGYFQEHAKRGEHPTSRHCPLVRRASGGGAIVHDHELTYSLVVPCDHRLAASARQLYDRVHTSLVATLAQWSVTARLHGGPGSAAPGAEPLLCFARRAVGDVLIGEVKIGGSAQRRRREAVLMHGSVLLERSMAAPELAGLCDLTQVRLTAAELALAWQPFWEAELAVVGRPGQATEAERTATKELALRFGSDAWNHKS